MRQIFWLILAHSVMIVTLAIWYSWKMYAYWLKKNIFLAYWGWLWPIFGTFPFRIFLRPPFNFPQIFDSSIKFSSEFKLGCFIWDPLTSSFHSIRKFPHLEKLCINDFKIYIIIDYFVYFQPRNENNSSTLKFK